MTATGYDLLVLGGGSAGFAAAITAREAGRTAAIVEPGLLGGTCVNVGCVPSKALLAAGEAAWTMARHRFDGVPHASGPVDGAALVAAKQALVDSMRQTRYADVADAYGFDVIRGRGRFVDPATVEVAGRRITAGAFLIATGASPAAPPIPGLAEAGYWTSTTALEVTEVPRRLAVLGAGAVGLELGQYFLQLGAEVSFVEIAERIAPEEEPEISSALREVLTEQGARVLTDARVRGVRGTGHSRVLDVEVDDQRVELAADELLVATGRRPHTDGLGLDAAGVALDEHGAVRIDAGMRTTSPRVWAAGDVTGGPHLVYVAAYQAALAAENALLGADLRADYTGLPRVIFTSPQLAAAGRTAGLARQAGHEVRTSVLPNSALPRALVAGDTRGVVKLVADAGTGRLLGASMLGHGAGDVIQSAVLAIRHGLTTVQLAGTFHPYLTMAEGLKLAAQSFTRDVRTLSCCAP